MSVRYHGSEFRGPAKGSVMGLRRGIAAASAGILVAVALVVPTMIAAAPAGALGSSPTGPPPFHVSVDTSRAQSGPGLFVFDVSITAIIAGPTTTAWTAFRALNTSTYRGWFVAADLLTANGQVVAQFISLDSYSSAGYGLPAPSGVGGWVSGYAYPVVVGDTFMVSTDVPPSQCELSMYMAQSGGLHWFEGQDLSDP